MLSKRPILTAALVLCAFAAPALAAKGRIALLSGEVYPEATLQEITESVIAFRDQAGNGRREKLDELVSVTRRGQVKPVSDPRPHHVLLLLRGGDRIQGELLPGKEEMISISSPHVGPLSFHVDDVAEVRFVGAWRKAGVSPPPPTGEQDFDLFTYRNLDRLEGTFLRITARTVLAHTRISEEHAINFAKLLAVRFADAPPPARPKGRITELRLVDGSRLTARSVKVKGEKLTAVSLRNEKIELELSSLLSLHQKGGRFVYLSDIPPTATKIVPWIGEAYAWDRPRVDRNFLDRPILVGGEAWQKGIGVISGTAMTWKLDGTFRTFQGRIALDDAAGEEGDVIFEVYVDGKRKYRSETLRRAPKGGSPVRVPPIDLSKAKTLTLKVVYVDDFVMDFADWIEPMLVR
jgi:hypothetical protein